MTSRNTARKSGSRTRVFVALIAAASMLLAACSSPGSARTSGSDELTVRVAAGASGPFTSQFNPLLNASKDASGNSSYVIFEPLMIDDVANSRSKPWLAKSGDWSDGGKTLTIKLRDDVKWSDGQPMTGEDVAFTFQLMGKYPALNFYGLPIASATAPSADTTVVTFTKPAFQYLWSNTTPVPEHLWKDVADPVKYTNPNPVGTGPFALKSFSPQAITLERNSHYWGEQPRVNTAQYLSFDSESSMLAALQAGQVDWITTGTADPAAIAKQAPSKIGYWTTNPSPAMIFLYPNDAVAPTSDPHLRLAISQAIDRANVSKLAFGDKNAPAESPTGLDPKSRATSIAPQYRDLTFSGTGAEAAKQTLISAGYTAGTSGTFSTPGGKPLESSGYAAIPVLPRDIPRLDPWIRVRDEYALGVFFPGEGHITVPLLIRELLAAAAGYGAALRHSTRVDELFSDPEGVKGVILESGERIESDVVVVAAGAGIGPLLTTQGASVRTEGALGVTVTTSPGTSKLTTVLHVPGLAVRPDSSGRVVVRSSAIDAEIDGESWTLPEPALRKLFEQLGEGLIDVDPAMVRAERIRIAHRPKPIDGLPVVGFWDGSPGLYVATVPTGVTLGALTGRLAAEEITTGVAPKLLEGFQPHRVVARERVMAH